jgi:hypothetical protein
MKKNYYKYQILLASVFAAFGNTAQAQVLTPYTGSNSIPGGTVMTLCSHGGCGTFYNDNASGYTVIYPGACVGINISGTYDTEGCCDDVIIYDGIGTGGSILQSYAGSGNVNYTAAPGQTITVQLSSDGSITYTGFQVTVNSGAAINVNGGVTDYTLCSGTQINLAASGADTYFWSTGSNSPTIPITANTNTTYVIAGINNAYPNCPLSNTVNITVNPSPLIAVSGGTVRCGTAGSIQLSVSGIADTYSWSTGSSANIINVSPMQATTYYVVGTNTLNGCTTTKAHTVLYSPSPVPGIFTPTTAICEGASLNIFATGADTYTWSHGPVGALITISPSVTTTFAVMGLNSYGCSGTATQVITVNPLPVVTASASKNMVCTGDALTITGGGADTYVWMAYSFLSSGPVISITPQVTTSYTVTGTDVNGCTNTAVVAVAANPCTGINEINASLSGMAVYPNPASSDFLVSFHSAQLKTIRVMDLTGRIIHEVSSGEARVNFDISEFASGIYFVRAQSGDLVETIKLIKE